MLLDEMKVVCLDCVVLILTYCIIGGGCSPRAADTRPLALVVSGDTAGWIVPCGCTSNQSGGLPRRGGYIAALREGANVLVADVGGAPGGKAAYDRLKFEFILEGEKAMGIAAHNIGAAEAALGADYLEDVARRLEVPFVSANVFRSGGKRMFEPVRVIDAAGRRVIIAGVLSPQFAVSGLHVTAPRQAVVEALRGATGRYDAVIVLAYLPEDELRELADTLPEADAVIGRTRQAIQPKLSGPTLLCSVGRQGKFIARLDAPAPGSAARWAGEIVELGEKIDDDPLQLANLKKFRAELGKRDFQPADTSFVQSSATEPPAGFFVAGSEKCRECHAEDCHTCDKAKHAQAWKSLQQKGAHVDPECQRCHTTGYGQAGGFVSVLRSPKLVQVGCESCHGPSKAHVRDPKIRTPNYAEAKNRCVGCHDRENSPQFAYDDYWAKIRHGEPAKEPVKN